MCHYPGGPSRALLDARYDTPLTRQNLVNGELAAGDLGLVGAKIIVPGDVNRSILYQRVKRFDFFRMPPAALNDDPSPLLPALEEWIMSLKNGEPAQRVSTEARPEK